MMRLFSRAALAVLLATGFATAAHAHAHLRAASPAAGSRVAAPSQVQCDFTEALEARFSSLEVQDAGGRRVDSGDMHLAAADARRMLLGLPRLADGVYTVIWHATSIDTHRTEGRFTFTVGR